MTASRHFSCPVTTVVTRRVRRGREEDYAAAIQRVLDAVRGFEGYLGTTVLGPHGEAPVEYTAIFTFSSTESLSVWMESEERHAWLTEIVPLVQDDAEVESLSGLETWFVLPGRSQAEPPPRWKQALLTALGVYPLLMVLNLTLVPQLGDLALPIRLGVVLLVGIPILNWIVMPWLSRLFFRWLYGTD